MGASAPTGLGIVSLVSGILGLVCAKTGVILEMVGFALPIIWEPVALVFAVQPILWGPIAIVTGGWVWHRHKDSLGEAGMVLGSMSVGLMSAYLF